MRTRQPTTTLEHQRIPVRVMASGLLGVLGMSDQEWERAGERGELPSGEPEVASPVEQRSTATA